MLSFVDKTDTKLEKNRQQSYLPWAIVFVFIVVPLLITFGYIALTEGAENKKYLPDLKKIADQTPVYPGFEKIGEDNVVLKTGRISVQRSYRSDAQFGDIRKFYDAALAKNGWGPPDVPPPSIFVGEHYYVHYRRGTYEIGISRAGDGNYHFAFMRYLN